MGRLTKWNENKQLLVREEERLLNANGIITKDEMYKIMRHLAEKLAQYEDSEEQGLLSRFPVPIGTTVYKFEPLAKGTKRYIKTTVTKYDVFDDSIWFCFANGLGRNIKDFGKFVFLTREEAEQKLKEMESD